MTTHDSSDSRFLIYGATGYTGRMAVARARAAGLDVIVAGRAPVSLAELGSSVGAEHRAFALDDERAVDEGLRGVAVVLNCAGPFMRTAAPLIRGAIRTGVHYLDVAAELDGYRLAELLDESARGAGVMLLPGSGGSVAMLGCLASTAAARVREPRELAIALRVSGSMSRGSAISARDNLATECLERVDGVLRARSPEGMRDFDFGAGPVPCFPVTLPDLLTIPRVVAAPDVATFVHVAGGAFPSGDLAALPDGPSAEEREANRYRAAVEVTGATGECVRAMLDTVNGYSFTPWAAVEAARRVLGGEARPGFQTPAGVFGAGFAETIGDTTITFW